MARSDDDDADDPSTDVSAASGDPGGSPAEGAGAAAVADLVNRSFPTSFRGFDPTEVRAFLGEVAGRLRAAHEREAELEAEVASLREASAADVAALDPEVLTVLVGEEAARVLATAREGAERMRARAEENVARLLREAQDEVAALRAQVDLDAARIRQEAAERSEAELEDARRRGREMVAEAQAARERMLTDLARRRAAARDQIAMLMAERDRLALVLGEVQEAAERSLLALAEAGPLPEEPEPMVPLPDVTPPPAPSTGPSAALPITSAALPRTSAAHQRATGSGSDGEADAGADLEGGGDVVEGGPAEGGPAEGGPAEGGPAEAATAGTRATEVATVEEVSVEEVSVEEVAVEETSVEGITLVLGEAPDLPAPEPADTRRAVDDLFTRIRAARAGAESKAQAAIAEARAGTAGAVAPAPDAADQDGAIPAEDPVAAEDPLAAAEATLAARAEALAPVRAALASGLKRVLADEQNALLERLRRHQAGVGDGAAGSLDGPAEHAAPFLRVARAHLYAAVAAGAGGDGVVDVDALAEPLLGRVRDDLADPLLEHLAHATEQVVDDDDAAARVRAAYREWKSQRIDDLADDLTLAGHGAGAFAALAEGTPVRWVPEPGAAPCAEADANARAGVLPCGTAFPTGDVHVPAHPGCHCALVPARA